MICSRIQDEIAVLTMQ